MERTDETELESRRIITEEKLIDEHTTIHQMNELDELSSNDENNFIVRISKDKFVEIVCAKIVNIMKKEEKNEIIFRILRMNPKFLDIGYTLEDVESLIDDHQHLVDKVNEKKDELLKHLLSTVDIISANEYDVEEDDYMDRIKELNHEKKKGKPLLNDEEIHELIERFHRSWDQLQEFLKIRSIYLENCLKFHRFASDTAMSIEMAHNQIDEWNTSMYDDDEIDRMNNLFLINEAEDQTDNETINTNLELNMEFIEKEIKSIKSIEHLQKLILKQCYETMNGGEEILLIYAPLEQRMLDEQWECEAEYNDEYVQENLEDFIRINLKMENGEGEEILLNSYYSNVVQDSRLTGIHCIGRIEKSLSLLNSRKETIEIILKRFIELKKIIRGIFEINIRLDKSHLFMKKWKAKKRCSSKYSSIVQKVLDECRKLLKNLYVHIELIDESCEQLNRSSSILKDQHLLISEKIFYLQQLLYDISTDTSTNIKDESIYDQGGWPITHCNNPTLLSKTRKTPSTESISFQSTDSAAISLNCPQFKCDSDYCHLTHESPPDTTNSSSNSSLINHRCDSLYSTGDDSLSSTSYHCCCCKHVCDVAPSNIQSDSTYPHNYYNNLFVYQPNPFNVLPQQSTGKQIRETIKTEQTSQNEMMEKQRRFIDYFRKINSVIDKWIDEEQEIVSRFTNQFSRQLYSNEDVVDLHNLLEFCLQLERQRNNFRSRSQLIKKTLNKLFRYTIRTPVTDPLYTIYDQINNRLTNIRSQIDKCLCASLIYLTVNQRLYNQQQQQQQQKQHQETREKEINIEEIKREIFCNESTTKQKTGEISDVSNDRVVTRRRIERDNGYTKFQREIFYDRTKRVDLEKLRNYLKEIREMIHQLDNLENEQDELKENQLEKMKEYSVTLNISSTSQKESRSRSCQTNYIEIGKKKNEVIENCSQTIRFKSEDKSFQTRNKDRQHIAIQKNDTSIMNAQIHHNHHGEMLLPLNEIIDKYKAHETFIEELKTVDKIETTHLMEIKEIIHNINQFTQTIDENFSKIKEIPHEFLKELPIISEDVHRVKQNENKKEFFLDRIVELKPIELKRASENYISKLEYEIDSFEPQYNQLTSRIDLQLSEMDKANETPTLKMMKDHLVQCNLAMSNKVSKHVETMKEMKLFYGQLIEIEEWMDNIQSFPKTAINSISVKLEDNFSVEPKLDINQLRIFVDQHTQTMTRQLNNQFIQTEQLCETALQTGKLINMMTEEVTEKNLNRIERTIFPVHEVREVEGLESTENLISENIFVNLVKSRKLELEKLNKSVVTPLPQILNCVKNEVIRQINDYVEEKSNVLSVTCHLNELEEVTPINNFVTIKEMEFINENETINIEKLNDLMKENDNLKKFIEKLQNNLDEQRKLLNRIPVNRSIQTMELPNKVKNLVEVAFSTESVNLIPEMPLKNVGHQLRNVEIELNKSNVFEKIIQPKIYQDQIVNVNLKEEYQHMSSQTDYITELVIPLVEMTNRLVQTTIIEDVKKKDKELADKNIQYESIINCIDHSTNTLREIRQFEDKSISVNVEDKMDVNKMKHFEEIIRMKKLCHSTTQTIDNELNSSTLIRYQIVPDPVNINQKSFKEISIVPTKQQKDYITSTFVNLRKSLTLYDDTYTKGILNEFVEPSKKCSLMEIDRSIKSKQIINIDLANRSTATTQTAIIQQRSQSVHVAPSSVNCWQQTDEKKVSHQSSETEKEKMKNQLTETDKICSRHKSTETERRQLSDRSIVTDNIVCEPTKYVTQINTKLSDDTQQKTNVEELLKNYLRPVMDNIDYRLKLIDNQQPSNQQNFQEELRSIHGRLNDDIKHLISNFMSIQEIPKRKKGRLSKFFQNHVEYIPNRTFDNQSQTDEKNSHEISIQTDKPEEIFGRKIDHSIQTQLPNTTTTILKMPINERRETDKEGMRELIDYLKDDNMKHRNEINNLKLEKTDLLQRLNEMIEKMNIVKFDESIQCDGGNVLENYQSEIILPLKERIEKHIHHYYTKIEKNLNEKTDRNQKLYINIIDLQQQQQQSEKQFEIRNLEKLTLFSDKCSMTEQKLLADHSTITDQIDVSDQCSSQLQLEINRSPKLEIRHIYHTMKEANIPEKIVEKIFHFQTEKQLTITRDDGKNYEKFLLPKIPSTESLEIAKLNESSKKSYIYQSIKHKLPNHLKRCILQNPVPSSKETDEKLIDHFVGKLMENESLQKLNKMVEELNKMKLEPIQNKNLINTTSFKATEEIGGSELKMNFMENFEKNINDRINLMTKQLENAQKLLKEISDEKKLFKSEISVFHSKPIDKSRTSQLRNELNEHFVSILNVHQTHIEDLHRLHLSTTEIKKNLTKFVKLNENDQSENDRWMNEIQFSIFPPNSRENDMRTIYFEVPYQIVEMNKMNENLMNEINRITCKLGKLDTLTTRLEDVEKDMNQKIGKLECTSKRLEKSTEENSIKTNSEMIVKIHPIPLSLPSCQPSTSIPFHPITKRSKLNEIECGYSSTIKLELKEPKKSSGSREEIVYLPKIIENHSQNHIYHSQTAGRRNPNKVYQFVNGDGNEEIKELTEKINKLEMKIRDMSDQLTKTECEDHLKIINSIRSVGNDYQQLDMPILPSVIDREVQVNEMNVRESDSNVIHQNKTEDVIRNELQKYHKYLSDVQQTIIDRLQRLEKLMNEKETKFQIRSQLEIPEKINEELEECWHESKIEVENQLNKLSTIYVSVKNIKEQLNDMIVVDCRNKINRLDIPMNKNVKEKKFEIIIPDFSKTINDLSTEINKQNSSISSLNDNLKKMDKFIEENFKKLITESSVQLEYPTVTNLSKSPTHQAVSAQPLFFGYEHRTPAVDMNDLRKEIEKHYSDNISKEISDLLNVIIDLSKKIDNIELKLQSPNMTMNDRYDLIIKKIFDYLSEVKEQLNNKIESIDNLKKVVEEKFNESYKLLMSGEESNSENKVESFVTSLHILPLEKKEKNKIKKDLSTFHTEKQVELCNEITKLKTVYVSINRLQKNIDDTYHQYINRKEIELPKFYNSIDIHLDNFLLQNHDRRLCSIEEQIIKIKDLVNHHQQQQEEMMELKENENSIQYPSVHINKEKRQIEQYLPNFTNFNKSTNFPKFLSTVAISLAKDETKDLKEKIDKSFEMMKELHEMYERVNEKLVSSQFDQVNLENILHELNERELSLKKKYEETQKFVESLLRKIDDYISTDSQKKQEKYSSEILIVRESVRHCWSEVKYKIEQEVNDLKQVYVTLIHLNQLYTTSMNIYLEMFTKYQKIYISSKAIEEKMIAPEQIDLSVNRQPTGNIAYVSEQESIEQLMKLFEELSSVQIFNKRSILKQYEKEFYYKCSDYRLSESVNSIVVLINEFVQRKYYLLRESIRSCLNTIKIDLTAQSSDPKTKKTSKLIHVIDDVDILCRKKFVTILKDETNCQLNRSLILKCSLTIPITTAVDDNITNEEDFSWYFNDKLIENNPNFIRIQTSTSYAPRISTKTKVVHSHQFHTRTRQHQSVAEEIQYSDWKRVSIKKVEVRIPQNRLSDLKELGLPIHLWENSKAENTDVATGEIPLIKFFVPLRKIDCFFQLQNLSPSAIGKYTCSFNNSALSTSTILRVDNMSLAQNRQEQFQKNFLRPKKQEIFRTITEVRKSSTNEDKTSKFCEKLPSQITVADNSMVRISILTKLCPNHHIEWFHLNKSLQSIKDELEITTSSISTQLIIFTMDKKYLGEFHIRILDENNVILDENKTSLIWANGLNIFGVKWCPPNYRQSRIHHDVCVHIGTLPINQEGPQIGRHYVEQASAECTKLQGDLLTATQWNSAKYSFQNLSASNEPVYFDNIRTYDDTSTMISEACDGDECVVMSGIYFDDNLGKYFSNELRRDRTEYLFDYDINPLRSQYIGEEEIDMLFIHPLGPQFYFNFIPSFGEYVTRWVICEKLGLSTHSYCPEKTKKFDSKCIFIKLMGKYIDRDQHIRECHRHGLSLIRIQKYETILYLYNLLKKEYTTSHHFLIYYYPYKIEEDLHSHSTSSIYSLDFQSPPNMKLLNIVPAYELSQTLRSQKHDAQKFLKMENDGYLSPFKLSCLTEYSTSFLPVMELPEDAVGGDLECGNYKSHDRQATLNDESKLIVVRRGLDRTTNYGYLTSEDFSEIRYG
ncbi:hypothetical protein SNEBB_005583, partial [Seison nebaliae]